MPGTPTRQLPDGSWVDEFDQPTPAPGPIFDALHPPAAAPPTPTAPAPPPPLPIANNGPMLQKTSTSTTSTSATKAERGLSDERKNLAGQQRTAIETTGDYTDEKQAAADRYEKVAKPQADAELVKAQDEERIAKEREIERSRIAAERQEAITAAQQTSDQELQKYRAMKPRDFFEEKTEQEEVGIFLGIALAGIGSAIAGRRGNSAQEALDKMISRHDAKERARIEKQFTQWQMSKGGIEEAIANRDRALIDHTHKFAGLLDSVAREAAKKKAMTGASEEEIKRDETVAKYDKAAALAKKEAIDSSLTYVDKELQRQQGLRSSSTTNQTLVDPALARGGAAGKMTGSQEETAGALGLLMSNLEQLSKLPHLGPKALERIQDNRTKLEGAQVKGPVSALANVAGRSIGIVPKTELDGLTPVQKQAFVLWKDVRAQMMKVMTGAGFAASEMADAEARYTPQPGDTMADTKAKFEGARRFVKELSVKTGAARAGIEQRLQAVPAGGVPASGPVAAAGGGDEVKELGGKRYVKRGGRWFEEAR